MRFGDQGLGFRLSQNSGALKDPRKFTVGGIMHEGVSTRLILRNTHLCVGIGFRVWDLNL